MIRTAPYRHLAIFAALLFAGCAQTEITAPTPASPAHIPVFESREVPVLHSKVFRTILDNGTVVIVIPRPVVPVVSFRIGIRAGSAQDPKGQEGVASLTASLLNRGTETRDALSIFRAIDASGGDLEATAGRDLTTISGKVLTSDLDPLFTLAADMVRHPVFKDEEFGRNLEQAKASLLEERNHAGPIARNLLYKTLFGTGPYGHPSSGTLDSLSTLTRSEVVDFYHAYYRPDRTLITFAGDITPEKALALVKSAFGDWKVAAPAPFPTLPVPPNPNVESQTLLVDRPDLAQAMVIMGTYGLRRDDPRFYDALVMNQILGGSTTSTLNHVVRQKNGLVYYIYSGFDAERHTGPFFVTFQTHAPNTPKVLELTRKILRESRDAAVSEKTVATVQNNLLGQFPFRVDSDDRIASLLLYIETYRLGLTYFTDYPDRVKAVTPQTVQDAAHTFLHPEHMVTVIVGPTRKTRVREGTRVPLP